ncbi:hypothetical protein GCM10010404_34760 [Nonomuraea africana]
MRSREAALLYVVLYTTTRPTARPVIRWQADPERRAAKARAPEAARQPSTPALTQTALGQAAADVRKRVQRPD